MTIRGGGLVRKGATEGCTPAHSSVRVEVGYTAAFGGALPMLHQILALEAAFGLCAQGTRKLLALGFLEQSTLPKVAEDWFAIPTVEALAPGGGGSSAQQYAAAVEVVLRKLKGVRGFHNFRADRMGHEWLSRQQPTHDALAEIAEAQKGNPILMLPAQFGFRHRGYSEPEVAQRMFPGEFNLGIVEVASMLLVHPTRLEDRMQLGAVCAGDRHEPWSVACPTFPDVPRFYCHADPFSKFEVLKLDTEGSGVGKARFGYVTGFGG